MTAALAFVLCAVGYLWWRHVRALRRELDATAQARNAADLHLAHERANRQHAERQIAMLRVDVLRHKTQIERYRHRAEIERVLNARLMRDLYGDDKWAAALARWAAMDADWADVPEAEWCDQDEREAP